MQRRRRSHNSPVQSECLETRALLSSISVTSLDDNTRDDGVTTLREAVAASRNGDTIEFAVEGRVELSSTLVVNKILTIRGRGTEQTVLDGGGSVAMLYVTSELSIEDLSMHNGYSTGDGGALNVRFGSLNVDNVHFVNNEAEQGGAIMLRNSFATITNSEFERNLAGWGGAIHSHGRTQTISDSQFTSNEATQVGGAIYARRTGAGLHVVNSEFTENHARSTAGAGYRIRSVVGSSFVDNSSGTLGGALVQADVSSSSFQGNTSRNGGAVYDVDVTNSTFDSNIASSNGGAAIYGEIENSTLINNRAGGSGGGAYGLARLESSIVANNFDGGGRNDISTAIGVLSSLIGTADDTGLSPTGSTPDQNGNLVGSNSDPMDPGLMPVGFYGGQVAVAPPQSDSPVTDLGTNPGGLAEDGRGANRVQGTAIDMGAYEGSVESALFISDPVIVEDSGELVFEVSHIGTADAAFSVTVATQNGTATHADYTPTSRTLSFSRVGPQTREVRVPITSDALEENSETVRLQVTGVSDPAVEVAGHGTGSIVNDDKQDGIVFTDGLLNIRGTDQADSITISESDGTITARFNGETLRVASVDIDSVQVIAKGGHDVINLSGLRTRPALLKGGGGHDVIIGGLGNDTIIGGGGDDEISGGDGKDSITGGVGDDTLRGEAGADTLVGGDGNDVTDGGDGNDSVRGSDGADVMAGGDGRDTLYGDNGADEIEGGDDGDFIYGGAGDNTLRGGDGADWIVGGDDNDLVVGGSGADSMWGDKGRDTLIGQGGNDVLQGGDGPDLLKGSAGADVAVGGRGFDTLQGGGGNDFMIAGHTSVSASRLAAWTAHSSYANAVALMKVFVRPSALQDDGHADSLVGGSGLDLFYASVGSANRDLFSLGNGEELVEI